MSAEAEKPIEPKKPIDVFAANRRFERFLGVDLNALREDQKGSYYPFELDEFRRQRETGIDPENEGKLIATVTFDHKNKKVIYDFLDGTHIEK